MCAALVAAGSLTSSASAQLNGVPAARLILDAPTAAGTATQLAALAYKPAMNGQPAVLWTATTGNGYSIRRITDFDSPGRVVETAITSTPWQNWQQDTQSNPTGTSLGQPVPSGLAINPYAVGTNAPYTLGVFVDQAGNVRLNGTTRYDLTKRVYTYNLGIGQPSPSEQFAGYGLFAAKTTTADLYAASGATTNPSVTLSQPVFSGDGRSVLYADSSGGAVGGIWRTDVVSGGAVQLIKDNTRNATDIGNRPVDTDGDGTADADRIVLSGSTNYGTLDALIRVDVPFGASELPATPTTLLTQDQIRTFLRGSAAQSYGVNKVLVDGEDVYLDVSGGTTPGAADPAGSRRSALLRLDAEGRLSKVISYAERRAAFAGGNTLTEKHFARDATFDDGVHPARTVRQIVFADRTLAQVEAAWVLDVGDFNTDGVVDDADMALLRAPGVLQPLAAVPTPDVSKFVFDLDAGSLADTRNASTATAPAVNVDYFDVKQLQRFYAFPDGDADFDRTVDFADLVSLAQNYGAAGRVWTQGEFTGDAAGAVDFADLVVLAQNYGGTTVPPDGLAGVPDGFGADWALARSIVPEPTGIVAITAMASLATRRRRRDA